MEEILKIEHLVKTFGTNEVLKDIDFSVNKGDVMAMWEPFYEPFIVEEDGIVQFNDLIEGKTVQEKVDETNNNIALTVMEFRTTAYKPSISIVDPVTGAKKMRRHGTTETEATYSLPAGAIVMVKNGDEVKQGQTIARRPRETSKTKDIVGGLPRVAELFEVRKPKDMAVVSEISGTVTYGGDSKGKRRLIVTPDIGEAKEYLVERGGEPYPVEFTYQYDLKSFFSYFSFFNVNEIARRAGINPSLMRQYVSGAKNAGEKTYSRLAACLTKITKELQVAQFG